ncbi:uncharacterized protein SCHCODRAFT_02498364 [Schizophyllum commune H4-8]|uniref:Uncharacterized protein n=1 Tax=Schizophyllum commune (strain H4-8 / FGSC 9210) TaxID=578458 RepID=D8PQH8_SCHCM|nr:uncharacterized protein SCHCODRAFT_02498364 [Schizophyllum commune H4-8]KAI5893619.1 hypothetical protein SCHCODRAFT_02498364 [Schizophyllum commune H4-8]
MVNADEALAIALAREEGADNQEAILASIGPSQAGASSAHPTGPAAAEASDDDLEYASEESVAGLAPSAPPDPYAPTPVEPLRISRPPRSPPNPPVEAPRPAPPRVPEIIITPETPTPPEAASTAQPGAERESTNTRRASTDTLPPYTSRVPSLLLPPAYDALSTLRASLPPSNMHDPSEASSADEVDVQEPPPTPRAAEARDWWREPFPVPSSIRRRRCTCGSRVYHQVVKKRYTGGSLWKRLCRESHARCRTAKPNCTVHCSGCGKAKGLCSIRGCDGSDSRCDMLLCCPQVRALALQSAFDVFDNFESEAFASLDINTLPSFDAIIRHESARDLVLDVLDAVRRLLDINIAQSSDDERARAASRWVVQTSTLFDAAWALFLPFNRFAATDSTLEHVYLEMLSFLRLLRRAELISQVDTPACAVEFSRTAMDMWLADADFASHLPELVPRPERMDTPLDRLLMELGNARGVMSMQASTTTSQPTRRKLKRLLSAIDDLLAEYDMLPA